MKKLLAMNYSPCRSLLSLAPIVYEAENGEKGLTHWNVKNSPIDDWFIERNQDFLTFFPEPLWWEGEFPAALVLGNEFEEKSKKADGPTLTVPENHSDLGYAKYWIVSWKDGFNYRQDWAKKASMLAIKGKNENLARLATVGGTSRTYAMAPVYYLLPDEEKEKWLRFYSRIYVNGKQRPYDQLKKDYEAYIQDVLNGVIE